MNRFRASQDRPSSPNYQERQEIRNGGGLSCVRYLSNDFILRVDLDKPVPEPFLDIKRFNQPFSGFCGSVLHLNLSWDPDYLSLQVQTTSLLRALSFVCRSRKNHVPNTVEHRASPCYCNAYWV